jgi:salicylate hydroxylase
LAAWRQRWPWRARASRSRCWSRRRQLGEIGAGIQLGANAFAAFDALGIGELARGRAVYTDEMVMHDALDERLVGRIPTGEAFRARFGNPYAVIHRADIHTSLLEGAQRTAISRPDRHRIERVEQDGDTVTVYDQHGKAIGARPDRCGWRQVRGAPAIRGRPARVSGHVVYRAVVDKNDFPEDLRWNAASIWVGPNYHLVHYPLRGGEQYNVVVTFHSRAGGMGRARRQPRRGAELLQDCCPRAPADRPAQELEALGHGRPRAHRPVELRPRHAAGRCPTHAAVHRRAPAWRWKTR